MSICQKVISTSFLGAVTAFGWGLSELAESKALNIYGWHGAVDLFSSGRPDVWLGDDAIVGRQICPPLTRFNLAASKPEAVILKSLPEMQKNGSGEVWTYALRAGLRWWTNTPITDADFATFMGQEFSDLTKTYKSAAVPKIIARTGAVEVHWSSPPPYGPYILNGHPFWRANSAQPLGYECAGLYKIASVSAKKSITLTPAASYSASFDTLRIEQDPATKQAPYVAFDFAEDRTQTNSVSTATCHAKLDVPIVTAIVWNPEGIYTKSTNVRQALTHATPRGEILRTAGGNLGALISAPILRNHPGYMAKMVVRNYSLETADQLLDKEGFTQSAIGIARKGADGKVMHLKIGTTTEHKQEVIEKIISDSLASLGIEVEFIPKSSNTDLRSLDGVISGIALPWPSLNLLETFAGAETSSPKIPPFFVNRDTTLSQSLHRYALSYFSGKVDFGELRTFHARFLEVEPWTVIMSHQACVVAKGFGIKGRIAIEDPDWFRRQIID